MGTIMTDEERKAWLAVRKEAGLKIDPETAEVDWIYALTLDPYGVYPDLPADCVGREYFARAPGSDVWVSFDDLPDATREALWEKYDSKLAFPAGLPLASLNADMSAEAFTEACEKIAGGSAARAAAILQGRPRGHGTDSGG